MVLLQVEFTLLRTIASRPVRSYRTLSPLPVPLRAIGGLLSAALVVACASQALPGTLLYEARTFLPFVSLPKDVNVSLPKGLRRQSPEGHQQSSDYPVSSEGGLYRVLTSESS